MKWFRRACWLAAWIGWAWLGFGLYRELPKEPGPLVSRLFLEHTCDWPVGFIADTDKVVVIRESREGFREETGIAVQVRDAITAKIERHIPADEFRFGELRSNWFSKSHGVLFATHESRTIVSRDGGLFRGLNLLDVSRGTWRRITTNVQHQLVFENDQPWIAFFELTRNWPPRKQVVVYDFVADTRILVRDDRNDSRIAERPFFIPNRATLVIPVRSPGPNKTLDDVDFELWKLDRQPLEPRIVKGFRVGDRPSIAGNGRVAFGAHNPETVHVFSIDDSRLLFSDVAQKEWPVGQSGPQHQPVGVGISRDGRRVIGASTMAVYDVDTGHAIWRPLEHHSAYSVGDGLHFQVDEQWSKLWSRWFPNLDYSSVAIRLLANGEMIHRSNRSMMIAPHYWNSSGTLAVTLGGSVHRLPYVVNWPLLIVCQAILATPLILLWAILRWRRRRARLPVPRETI